MKRLERSVARAGALIAILGAAAAVLPATALATSVLTISAAASSPCVESGTTTTYLGNVGSTCGITYTLKAPSTDTLTDVGFTDQLPAGAVLDDEVGETAKNCGVPFIPSNQPRATTVTESGLTVIGSSAPNYVGSCTITLEFVANAVETSAADAITPTAYDNTPNGGLLTSEPAGTAGVTGLSLTVAGLPTITIAGLTNNATYRYGQSVSLSFSAVAAANDSIAAGGVYATDDQGNTLSLGQAVNTDVPGTHQVEVWVQTVDGYLGSQTYSYTVKSPKLTSVKTTKSAEVKFGVKYLGAGSVLAEVLDGKTVIGKVTEKVSVGRTTTVTVAPTAAGKRFLAKLKTTKSIKATLTVLYTASNWSYPGTQPTIKKSGITLR